MNDPTAQPESGYDISRPDRTAPRSVGVSPGHRAQALPEESALDPTKGIPTDHQTPLRTIIDNLRVIPDFLSDIMEFHERFGLEYNGKPRLLTDSLADFRYKFSQEELDEWDNHNGRIDNTLRVPIEEAEATYYLEKQLDTLVDQAYVLFGTIYLQGLAPVFHEAWRRVHEKNMQKARKVSAGEGHTNSGRAPKYDVVKPQGWTPPDHTDLVEDHAHRTVVEE